MDIQHSTYHKFLRVALVVCAVVLVFESGLLSESTARVAEGTHAYLANAVGMSASVQPTELNTLTAELTAKQRELDAREAALREREIAVDLNSGAVSSNTSSYVLSSILFVLLVLIILNYALDYLRSREEREVQPV
ncbi:MAG: hypothetical protein KC877_00610 [Candidatus Kaiserbacteria bacterium]|nr:hypothetical protein [Candidatus Kaiserbacteria bacterium]MCB9815932.1 hypothetical protein [Candidatus Nomurabacteria bacterium]